MVEVLGHVGEGFVAEMTPVQGICSVGLPVRHQEVKMKQAAEETKLNISRQFLTVIRSLLCLPVHDKSHLSGEAIAAVHTKVPGHA